ncbi:hypothetical protein Q0590_05900 [Rhodocytophaga aerolata]|uniref:DUF2846 domain-containing protein n=1 Tax=Rhodocytophaga aerolata TaxID=455078 RepID=A0ABT8R112_9BACT|nr:hypothetical protein [Rhodocytophaga aerolata]MDO1445773.1 hypothetical protein [Rhodocytophaga aerolata]
MKNYLLWMCIGITSCSFQKYSATQRVNRADTIRFGQYYLDNAQANFPLILVYDSKTGQQLDKVENGKEYIIELKAGKFNHYHIKAEALNNGKVVKTKNIISSVYRLSKQISNLS